MASTSPGYGITIRVEGPASAKVAATKGEVPVGAIVVNELGDVLGIGHNLREENNDPTAHAEIVAMRNAATKISNWRMDDLTMF